MRQEEIVKFCNEIAPLKYRVSIETSIDKLNLDTIPSLLEISGVKKVSLLKPTDDRNYSKLVKRLEENGIELSGWKSE